MRNRWLLCVFLAALSWGQAAPGSPSPAQSAPAPTPPLRNAPAKPAAPADTSASVPPTAAVLTVKGVCAAQPKPAAAKGAAAKPAPAAKIPPADCETVITKSEFDTLLKAIPGGCAAGETTDHEEPASTRRKPAPNRSRSDSKDLQACDANPQVKRNVAARLPQFIAWSNEAKKQGLDKKPEFAEMMKFVKMQVLASEMQQKVKDDAAKISDEDLAAFYKNSSETFEQYSLERLFVPRAKQMDAKAEKEELEDKEEKKELTDEQKKAKEAEEKTRQEENMEAMTKLADSLRSRAAAGEDFAALQKEAYDAAGMKIASPNVSMPNQRRTSLPPSQAAVFELQPGDVSQVINDAGGHYIYKLKSKEQLSLDQVKEEIRRTLTNQRSREATDKVNNSFKVEKNEAYFGPEVPMGPGPRLPMQRPPNAPMPQPQSVPVPPPQAAPVAPAAPAAQPAQPPAPKPN